jgi:hypothetical protein
MKRLVLLALLALALPLSAFADTWDFTNNDGTLVGSAAGLSLGNSILTVIDTPGLTIIGLLGTVNFATGNQVLGGFNPGGFFTINAAAFGLIFNGTFTGLVTLVSEGNGIYQISGPVAGILTFANGDTEKLKGFTSQLYLATGTIAAGTFCSQFGSGDTILATPEPGTLGLLGTGLLGLAGVVRKKLKT